jgi:topoisomerase-4 subunit A
MSDISGEVILETPLTDALSERYLAYALSTIVSRSLPDVRDGLKPVHRRLLFAMRQLKLDPKTGFKKCARVVGDVIGKYHPHGDQAVYDTMVRLAQEFAVRYPLVEGHGNFGNIDGDNAAAMRYTEARLTTVAIALMEGLDENAVGFRDTYDGEDSEPVVMPAAFPNLLANGATGIAVGMATNIPPHNAGEICDALQAIIQQPAITTADLLRYVPAPDFPTGGVLLADAAGIRKAYETGRGVFRLRAAWEKVSLSHGLYQIVITEIPYQVQKSKLVERIAELMMAKKLPMLADIRDESTEDVRIVIDPKSRTVDAALIMEHLFKQTDLEIRFNLNMNVLNAKGVPGVMSLKQVLQSFLDHRREVLVRRSQFRLDKIAHRLEVLEGYLIAYLNLDEVIRIIREEDHPKQCLIDTFKLTDVQAEAILNMRLRALRKLEEMEIRNEHTALRDEQAGLESLLADEGKQWDSISGQIADIKAKFGQDTQLGARRTLLGDTPAVTDVPVEALIEKEPITVVLSEKGWIRAMKGHQTVEKDLKFKEGDKLQSLVPAYTTDKILIFASSGRFYTLAGDKIPGGRGFGEPLRLIVDLPADADVVAIFPAQSGGGQNSADDPGRKLLVASALGRGFVVAEESVIAQTKTGKQILNATADDPAIICLPMLGDTVATIGKNRKMLVFAASEVPELNRGRGVILQKYKDGGLSDIKVFNLQDGLSWKQGERTRTEKDLTPWLGKRAQTGRMPPTGFPRNNKF